MSTDKKKSKRTLTDADDPGKWTSNSEKKSKLAIIEEIQELDAPDNTLTTVVPIEWNPELETPNLESKLSQPPSDTPGSIEINDHNVTCETSEPLPELSFMTPNRDPTPKPNVPSNSSTHSTTALPTTVTPTYAITILNVLKDLQLDISSLKLELREIKRNLNKSQPENPNKSSFPAMPPAPPLSQPKLSPSNEMEIDSHDPVPEETNDPSDYVEPPHSTFLHDCFKDRIGISPFQRTLTTITSFDGIHIATGFNRILPTYQGYFVELEYSDILWTNLNKLENPDYGEESWHSPGLSVFRHTQKDTRTIPPAHRFAIKPHPDQKHPCNPLLLNKWYIHAYQVRFIVNEQHRSLNSRWMAARLNALFPQYHPRGRDRSRTVGNVAQEPTRHTAPNPQPIITAQTQDQTTVPPPKTIPSQPRLQPILPRPTGYPIPTIPHASVPSYYQNPGQPQLTVPVTTPRWHYQHQPAQQYANHVPNQPVPHWQYPPHSYQPVQQLSTYALNPASYGTSYARNHDRATTYN